jgi:rRNA-processing protein FCF1
MTPNKVIIDANLLTLWIVGQVSEDLVPKCRRTRQYTVDDYLVLANYLTRFITVIITPNIATEVSNLIGVLKDDHLIKARTILAGGFEAWTEVYFKSVAAKDIPEYMRLGLTDAAILLSVSRETEVLTDDFDLYRVLTKRGIIVTNFTHLRTAGMI